MDSLYFYGCVALLVVALALVAADKLLPAKERTDDEKIIRAVLRLCPMSRCGAADATAALDALDRMAERIKELEAKEKAQ